jgi:hypothetical protein
MYSFLLAFFDSIGSRVTVLSSDASLLTMTFSEAAAEAPPTTDADTAECPRVSTAAD